MSRPGTGAAAAALALVSLGQPTVAAAPSGPPGEPLYPNIVEAVPAHLQIQNDHQREWLRFTTVHLNLGPGNLQVRGGGQVEPCTLDGVDYEQCTVATQEVLDDAGAVVLTHPAGAAVFHAEHNHWHQSDVAVFRIRRDHPVTGPEVAAGVKVTFCLVDVVFSGRTGAEKKQSPRTYWECNGDLQGIAAGWGDSYHQSTPQQELDVTGLPEGEYYLTNEADPSGQWLEGPSPDAPSEHDNLSWVQFRLTRQGANPKVTVTGHSPCVVALQCDVGANP